MGEDIVYILVAFEKDFGYWEINIPAKKALFRDHETLIPADEVIIDYSEQFNDILEFLFTNWEQKHIKTIIPNRKYMFDSETPWCNWYKTGVDAHDPNTVLQCDNPARVLQEGRYFCAEHAGFSMTNNPVKVDRRMTGTNSGVKDVVG